MALHIKKVADPWCRVTFVCSFVSLREVKTSRGEVISNKDLEILLDRSDMLGEEKRHYTGHTLVVISEDNVGVIIKI